MKAIHFKLKTSKSTIFFLQNSSRFSLKIPWNPAVPGAVPGAPGAPGHCALGGAGSAAGFCQGAAEVGGAGSGAERCQGATAGEDLDILGWLGTDFWRFWGCFCGWFMVISWIYHELILIWVIMISTWWTSWILHPTESRSDSVVCSLCIKPTYTLRVNVEVYLADNVGWLNIDILNVDVQPLWRNQWTLEVQDHNIYIHHSNFLTCRCPWTWIWNLKAI